MIPIQRDDLLEGRDAGGYTVRHVYELAELRSNVHGKTMFLHTYVVWSIANMHDPVVSQVISVAFCHGRISISLGKHFRNILIVS